MTSARGAAVALAGCRIAYGVALLAVPDKVTKSWLGADGGRPGAVVALRALGAREVVIHVGALAAAVGGRPVVPWLAGSVAGDLNDVVATFVSGDGLPDGAPAKTLAVAGGSAALSAAVIAALDA